MTIDYDPGGSTMIIISKDVKKQLVALKLREREAIGDVIDRLILKNEKMPSTEMPI